MEKYEYQLLKAKSMRRVPISVFLDFWIRDPNTESILGEIRKTLAMVSNQGFKKHRNEELLIRPSIIVWETTRKLILRFRLTF